MFSLSFASSLSVSLPVSLYFFHLVLVLIYSPESPLSVVDSMRFLLSELPVFCFFSMSFCSLFLTFLVSI